MGRLSDRLLDVTLAGLVNNQATTVVCDGDIFLPVRERAHALSPWLGELVACHLCFGTWVGLMQALYRQLTGQAPRRGLAGFLWDALAIACMGRVLRRLIEREG